MKEKLMADLKDHLETWGPNCGAPLAVYHGHLMKLLESHAAAVRETVRKEESDGSE